MYVDEDVFQKREGKEEDRDESENEDKNGEYMNGRRRLSKTEEEELKSAIEGLVIQTRSHLDVGEAEGGDKWVPRQRKQNSLCHWRIHKKDWVASSG